MCVFSDKTKWSVFPIETAVRKERGGRRNGGRRGGREWAAGAAGGQANNGNSHPNAGEPRGTFL